MLIKKFFGVMLLLAMIALPQNVSAEKTDWTDKSFDFRRIRTVIVFDATFNSGMDYGGSIALRNLQDIYKDNAEKRLKQRYMTEAQARRELGYQLNMDLESLNFSNPLEARRIIMQNAYRIADAWVVANTDAWDDSSYVVPERTVWEQKQERRTYYDRYGDRHEETYYIQVPVTYPPHRVYVSSLQMTFQVFEARRGEMIFARKDVRDREDYQAQNGMFGRMCNSFFEDFAKKLR